MKVLFIIHMRQGWTCKCFSFADLAVNIDYALREHKQILGVEAL